VEALRPHAIQIRQTGGFEVLNWTPIASFLTRLSSSTTSSDENNYLHLGGGMPRRAFHEAGMSGRRNHTVI
jgi:hypothetical protein